MRRYKRTMPTRLALCLAVLCAAVFASPAAAQDNLDRIQVGYPGTVTRQFATSLSLAMTIPSGFRRDCCYDFETGAWVGPDVRYPSGRTTQSRVAWEVSFTRTSRSAKSVAQAAGWGKYPQVAAKKRTVRHVLGGRRPGQDQGLLRRRPGGGAVREDAGRADRRPRARRSRPRSSGPSRTPTRTRTPPGGAVTVNGLSSRAWNRRAAELALKSVALEGALPINKVKARARGRSVKGKVLDIAGQGVGQAHVILQRRAGGGWRKAAEGASSLTGTFSLKAPGSGQYRVVATFGSASARSKAVRVR